MDELQDEVVRYLTSTGDCWWTARRIGTVLPHASGDIDAEPDDSDLDAPETDVQMTIRSTDEHR